MKLTLNPLKAFTRNVNKNYELDSFTYSNDFGWSSTNRFGLKREYRSFVKTCMDIRAQEAAKYEPLIYNQNPRLAQAEPLENHEFLQLLDQPSPDLSKYELFELISLSLDLHGICYVYVALTASGRPAPPGQDGYGMTVIEPYRVQPIYDQNTGNLLGYKVNRPNGTIATLDKTEMLVFRLPEQLGIVQSNLLAIDTEQQTSILQNSFLRKSSNPGGVATVKGSITKEAFDKLKKQWADQQAGAQNAGRTLFIRNGDFTFDKIGLSIADLDIKVLKEIPKQEVREAFRVPVEKLGSVGSSGLGSRAAAETVNYVFANDVTDATQLRFDDAIEKYVRLVYPKETLFVNHVSQIPEDKEAIATIVNNLSNNVLDKDEARSLLERILGINLPELPNGEGKKFYIPFNLTEVGTEEPIAIQPQKAITISTTRKIPLSLPAPLKKSNRKQFFVHWDRLENYTDNQYKKEFESLIQRQEKKIIARLRNEMKALGDDISEGIETEQEAENWAKKLWVLLVLGYESGGNAAINYIQPDIDFILEQSTRDSIFKSTKRLMESFNRETALKIQKQMAIGLEKGETLDELTKRIETIYQDAKGSRAARIARTEAHRAVNEGVREGYKQSGVTHMQWVTDGNPCEFCSAMEGSITEIDTPFLEEGDTLKGLEGGTYDISYGSVKAADLHPNCNCKLVPVTPGVGNFSVDPKIVIVKHNHEETEALRQALLEEKEFSNQLKAIVGLEDES